MYNVKFAYKYTCSIKTTKLLLYTESRLKSALSSTKKILQVFD